MKKEICAALALLLLFIGALSNLTHLNKIMEQIQTHIDYSLLYCSLEDYVAAHTETTKAKQIWEDEERYSHVFIRHSEIDKMNDIFYDVLSAIQSHEKYEAEYHLKKLQHYADNLVVMEQLSLGSVF